MTGLLDLPFEVRFPIIDEVINAERHPTQFAEITDRGQRRSGWIPSWSGTDIWYEIDPKIYVTSGYGLLRTNRQLNRETRSLLARIPTTYKVDIALVGGQMLWPTWTFLPRKMNEVDLMRAVLHVRKYEGPKVGGQWQCMKEELPTFVNKVSSFFDHYYRFGVQGPPKDNSPIVSGGCVRNMKPSYTIKVLDIDCIDEVVEDHFPVNVDDEENCANNVRTAYRPHETCARNVYVFLELEIYNLLQELAGQSPYCHLLHVAIGKIKLRINGDIKREIDFSEWLMKIPNRWGGQDTSLWRQEAIRWRKSRGL